MSLACVRGCVTARRHLADCDGDPCRGCLPRLADFGALCVACHYRLARTLQDLPHARTLLAGHLAPGQAARSTDVITRSKGDPPAPLNLAVLDLIAEIDHKPRGWADVHAEEHQLTRPTDPAGYLLRHLASVECAEWIGDAWDELTDLMSRAHALVPWRREAVRLAAPCPQCHCLALVLYGGDDHVTCQECRYVVERGMYDHWARVLLEDAAVVVA